MKNTNRKIPAIAVLLLALGVPLLTLFQNCGFQVAAPGTGLLQTASNGAVGPDGFDRSFTSSFDGVEFGFTNKINVTHPAHPQNVTSFNRGLDLLQGRAQWVRVYFQDYDVLDYSVTPQSPTDLRFLNDRLARYDEAVSVAKARGFKVMLNFGFISDANLPFDQFLARTQAMAKFLAQRYPTVDAWQLVNEPNIFDFRSWGQLWTVAGLTDLRPETISKVSKPASWPAGKSFIRTSYVDELKQAIQVSTVEFKKVNPNVKTTIAVAWWPRGTDAQNAEAATASTRYFIDQIRPVVDVVGIDAYLTPAGIPVWVGSGEQAETQANFENALVIGQRFLEELVSKGEVWINETGYATEGPGRHRNQQLDVLQRSIQTFVNAGIKKIFIYELQDDFYPYTTEEEKKFNTIENSFGLLDHFGQPKEAYEALMAFISTKNAVSPRYDLREPAGWPSTDRSDNLSGYDRPDYLIGMAGNDRLMGLGGDDYIQGDDGDDILEGGAGHDYILSGNGNDKADGGDGDDFVNGNAGNDEVNGGNGQDTLYGGQGNDVIRGGPGNDVLYGNKGNDTFYYKFTDGADTIFDNEDQNTLICEEGLKAKNNPGTNAGADRTLNFNDGGKIVIKAGSIIDISSCVPANLGVDGSSCEAYNWSGQVRGQGKVQNGVCSNITCQSGSTLYFSQTDQKNLCVQSTCTSTVTRNLASPQVVSSMQNNQAACWQACAQATTGVWTEAERKQFNICWFERAYIFNP